MFSGFRWVGQRETPWGGLGGREDQYFLPFPPCFCTGCLLPRDLSTVPQLYHLVAASPSCVSSSPQDVHLALIFPGPSRVSTNSPSSQKTSWPGKPDGSLPSSGVAMASQCCQSLASASYAFSHSHTHTSVNNPFIKAYLTELFWVNLFALGILNVTIPTRPC